MSSEFSNPWRTNYAERAVGFWIVVALFTYALGPHFQLHDATFTWSAILAFLIGLSWVPPSRAAARRLKRLCGSPLTFTDLPAVQQIIEEDQQQLWLGTGFIWERNHAQLVHDLMRVGPERFIDNTATDIGARWLHGVAETEQPIRVPLSTMEGHLLVLGTTGAGKTRLFDLLITQAVLRGEAVICIDPKGDRELRDNMRRACQRAGREHKFLQFNPAYPEDSCRIDPMSSFKRPSELASRIAALIPSETGSDVFKSFSQMAMNHVLSALVLVEERPSLRRLRHYLEGGVDLLVTRAIAAYCRTITPEFDASVAAGTSREAALQAKSLIRHYRQNIAQDHPSPAIDGIISMFDHERAHFSKMVASLMPVLTMLTSSDIGDLLSPHSEQLQDPRTTISMADIVHDERVAYIGLDSLSDAMVGNSIGSLLLADLTAVAGDRYNYGRNLRPVNILIDEAAEVTNETLVQLLNKSRGAGFKLAVASQTTADFTARTGSEAKTLQILGNLNNLIALRVLDSATQEFVTDSLPKIRLRTMMWTHGSNTGQDNPVNFAGNSGERLIEEEGDLIPPAMLGHLPNLEYIARLAGGRVIKGRLPILTAECPPPSSDTLTDRVDQATDDEDTLQEVLSLPPPQCESSGSDEQQEANVRREQIPEQGQSWYRWLDETDEARYE